MLLATVLPGAEGPDSWPWDTSRDTNHISDDSQIVENAVQENGLTDKLVSLALLGHSDDLVDAAQYLEKLSGYEHQAVLLYHKACCSAQLRTFYLNTCIVHLI